MHEMHEPERNRLLIAEILQGKYKLFDNLVQPYERSLFRVANAFLRNEANAEEVVQDAILKAFLNLQQLESPTKFKPWLFRIVTNEARLKIRNSQNHLFESLDNCKFIPREFTDWRDNPLQVLECTEIRIAVNNALQSLPKIYREIFVLRDVQGLTVSECVEALGITAQTVKVRLHRARSRLRKKLASKCGRR